MSVKNELVKLNCLREEAIGGKKGRHFKNTSVWLQFLKILIKGVALLRWTVHPWCFLARIGVLLSLLFNFTHNLCSRVGLSPFVTEEGPNNYSFQACNWWRLFLFFFKRLTHITSW